MVVWMVQTLELLWVAGTVEMLDPALVDVMAVRKVDAKAEE